MSVALSSQRLVCDDGMTWSVTGFLRDIAWSEIGLCLRHYLVSDWFVSVALPGQRLVCDIGIACS